MKGRCQNPNHPSWKWYGAKGVKVCDRWQIFENFLEDMGSKPVNSSIDRIDSSRGYEPGNCRWASHKEQGRNKDDVIVLEIEGVSYIARELSEKYGLKVDTIVNRAGQGLSFDKVVDKKRRPTPQSAINALLEANRKAAEARFCQNGHEFTAENTDHYGGQRRCRECRLVVQRRYKERMKMKRMHPAACEAD